MRNRGRPAAATAKRLARSVRSVWEYVQCVACTADEYGSIFCLAASSPVFEAMLNSPCQGRGPRRRHHHALGVHLSGMQLGFEQFSHHCSGLTKAELYRQQRELEQPVP